MNALDPLAWSILLMLVGCVVLVLEVFIPSGGILAVLSAAAFVGSIVIAFQRGPVTGFTFVMTTVVAVPLVLVLAFHLWPKTRIGKAFLGELPTDADVLPDDPRSWAGWASRGRRCCRVERSKSTAKWSTP